MEEASGEPGTAAGPDGGVELPSRRVPGQRDPVARPEGAHPEHPEGAPSAESVRPEGHPEAYPSFDPGLDAGSALSDAELVAQVRGGRDSAYEELYRRHAESVRRYARTCCRDAHTAEDLTGEVFARTLQAIRGGSGPESAVRAYLLTTVRRVAASWGNTARREQLVEDFAVFAVTAAGASAAEGSDPGADVRAMQEAEQSLAIQAFRTLPERWQTVLWHTAVEDESPRDIAPLLGLTANATAVLAHRAREGLRQAYLQAHVSSALTAEGECARYADRLGAHARGGLRMRADRELNRHLKECERCTAASLELADLNSALKGLLPVAYIGWFAAVYAAKAAAAAVAGGAAAAGAAGGVAAAAAGSGSGGTAAGGGAAAGEGLGAPVKIGIAAAVVVAAAATAFALTGGGHAKPPQKPQAKPPVVAPVTTAPAPPPGAAKPTPEPVQKPAPKAPAAKPTPNPAPVPTTAAPSPEPTPKVQAPNAEPPAPTPAPTTPEPTPPPSTRPPTTPPPPPPAPTAYPLNSLGVTGISGDQTLPTIRPALSPTSWWWDRWGLDVGGTHYRHGISVHAPSRITIDLNRACVSYDARAGVDDLARLLRTAVRFSVYGDGTPLWSSGVVRGGDPAVPVHVGLAGYKTLQLVVTPQRRTFAPGIFADWAASEISCS